MTIERPIEIEDYAEFALTMNELLMAAKSITETWDAEIVLRPAPRSEQEAKLMGKMAFWIGTARARVERAEAMMKKLDLSSSG